MHRLAHLRYRRYVDALVDGELAGSVRHRVAAHLGGCAMCQRTAAVTLHVKTSLSRLRRITDPVGEHIRGWARHELR